MSTLTVKPHPIDAASNFLIITEWEDDPVGQLCSILDHSAQADDMILVPTTFPPRILVSNILPAVITQYHKAEVNLIFYNTPIPDIITRHDADPKEWEQVKQFFAPIQKLFENGNAFGIHITKLDYYPSDPDTQTTPTPPTHEQLVEVTTRLRENLTHNIHISVTSLCDDKGTLILKAVRYKTDHGCSVPVRSASFDFTPSLDSYSVLCLLADTLEDIRRPLTSEPESIVNTLETP